MKRLMIGAVLALAVVAALVLTSGGDDPERPAATVTADAVPQLAIPRLDGGEPYELASLNAAERPTLLWFWAPWCSICNEEAPNVEALAKDLDVVAIGGRDDAANGPPFVERHGLATPTLLFDEGMRSWTHYRIVGQPGAVLLDAKGRERARWSGPLDNAEVLAAAREISA